LSTSFETISIISCTCSVAFGSTVGLVVYVGDVPDVRDLVSPVLEEAHERVEQDVDTGVAEVGVVVDRGAADVQPQLPRLAGLQRVSPAREGVVYPDLGHGDS
jgi:hypothetical protein